MNINKKTFLRLLTLALLFSCALVSQGVAEKLNAPTTDIISKKIRDSIVSIEDEIGMGSGFFVERDKIATNIHVVARPGPILVKSADRKMEWTIEGVVAYDVKNDLAILKVREKGVPLSLTNINTVQNGASIFAAGFPDEEYKITVLTVDNIQNGEKLIRLKADLFPGNSWGAGNSGGPIVNRKGQVIGICALGSEHYGYAVPSNILKVLLTRSKLTEPLARWQKRKPIRAYVYGSQGKMELINKKYKSAIAKFDKAIQLNPNFANFYYRRGSAKHKLGNYERAIVDIEKGIKLDRQRTEPVEAYLALGAVKLTSGDYEGAIIDFDKVIRLVPKFTDAYQTRAVAKFQLGDYEAAIVDLDKAIKIDPEKAELYNFRASVKHEFGQSESKQWKTITARHLYEQAIEDFTRAINITPESHSLYDYRGMAQYNFAKFESEEGNIKKARKLYKAAINDSTESIQQNPNNEFAYQTRSFAKIALGDAKGAISDFDRLLQISSESDKDYYYYQRGLAKKTLGYHRSAIADFDKAIRLNPEEAAIVYYQRGLAKEALGQKESAKADFDKAKELDPDVGQK